MEDTTLDRPWEHLATLLESNSIPEIEAFLDGLTPGDTARCVARLDSEDRERVLELIDLPSAVDLIEQIPDAQGGNLLEHATPGKAAKILEQLSSDEQADLITSMPADSAEQILAEMDPEVAREAGELAAHAPNTAGGIMVTEYVDFVRSRTAGDVVNELRERVDEIHDYEVQYIYVTSDAGELVGVLRLRDLLLARGHQRIDSFMIASPLSVVVTLDLDGLADLFEAHSFLGVPVVDVEGRLCGVVHRSDVELAWGDRSESDHLKSQGIVGGEELRSMPTLLRSRRRLSWLSVNILLNVAAASVIAAYQDTLSEVIALAVFLPIISDMSGCSGNQAVAVSMRELTLGVIKPLDWFYVWRKEVSVGLINGVVLGGLIAATAWVWKGSPTLGLVVGGALAANTVFAVSLGGAVPLVLKRLKLDPALASGPILTTLTDMCGFFLALSLAAASMDSLRGV